MSEIILDAADAQARKDKRAAQARINGAHSHGPTSAEGKAKSSRNALKHGFAAKINILIAPDDSVAFDNHLARYRQSYRPTHYAEHDFVNELAAISWKKARLSGIETSLINFQLAVQEEKINEFFPLEKDNPQLHLALAWQALSRKPLPREMPADPNEPIDPTLPPDQLDIASLELIRRYMTSLDRQFRNTLLNFRQYRKDFAPSEPNEPTPVPIEVQQADEQPVKLNLPARTKTVETTPAAPVNSLTAIYNVLRSFPEAHAAVENALEHDLP